MTSGTRMYHIAIILLILVLSMPMFNCATNDNAYSPKSTHKYRVLVDKVMQRHERWVTKEWMVKAAADAGFNVYSPREGYDRYDEVRRVAKWCDKYGIDHIVWMRGTLDSPKDRTPAGNKLVWENGMEQDLWSPNSDAYWDWTTKHVLEYARISTSNRRLIGVFLDYENYAPGKKEGNAYSLSYDQTIMEKFAASKGIRLPSLKPAGRKTWLLRNGLQNAFSEFQINGWRERCRKLRAAVDAVNPYFRFCIYPAPGTLFMTEAVYPEWATDKAPLMLADATTYGRSSLLASEAEALLENRKSLQRNIKVPQKAGIPFIYMGGIDPVARGADPEFSGKNAVAISQMTDGYWIFYEGPTYTKEDHENYWQWFTWANKNIKQGQFETVSAKSVSANEGWGLSGVFSNTGSLANASVVKRRGRSAQYPKVRFRQENLFVIPAQAGKAVEVTFKHHPVSTYKSPLGWELRGPDQKHVAAGKIDYAKSGEVRFTPRSSGNYMLAMTAGNCAYSLVRATVPVGMFGGRLVSFFESKKRLYFSVPAGVDKFYVEIKGSGSETVRVDIYSPGGKKVATGQTTTREDRKLVYATNAGKRSGTWSLQITEATAGRLEDHAVRLDPKLPGVISFNPNEVWQSKVR